MHYFEKMSSASGGFAPRYPPSLCPWIPLDDFRHSEPLIAHPWKNPAGTHAYVITIKEPSFSPSS